MGRINLPRAYLAGVLAGSVASVVNVLAYMLGAYSKIYAVMRHEPNLTRAGVPVIMLQIFVGGPLAVWLYAAMRPRFGAGPRTALIAATFLWLVLLPYGWTILRLSDLLIWLPAPMLLVMYATGWPYLAGTVMVGAYYYREEERPA